MSASGKHFRENGNDGKESEFSIRIFHIFIMNSHLIEIYGKCDLCVHNIFIFPLVSRFDGLGHVARKSWWLLSSAKSLKCASSWKKLSFHRAKKAFQSTWEKPKNQIHFDFLLLFIHLLLLSHIPRSRCRLTVNRKSSEERKWAKHIIFQPVICLFAMFVEQTDGKLWKFEFFTAQFLPHKPFYEGTWNTNFEPNHENVVTLTIYLLITYEHEFQFWREKFPPLPRGGKRRRSTTFNISFERTRASSLRLKRTHIWDWI